MKKDYIEILKKKSYNISLGSIPELIEKIILEDKLVTFINPYSYLVFRKNIKIFNRFDYIFSDGILLTKLLNLSGLIKTIRLSFDMTSLATVVFTIASKNSYSIYLLGSGKKEIIIAQENILNNYPKLNVIGWRNGYFENSFERENTIIDICKLNPKIIIVGTGSGEQEKFLNALRDNGWKGTGFTCGGFFHQSNKNLKYYPNYINKLNLRAFYRIADEPKLLYRYLIIYPFAVFLFIWEIIKYLYIKNEKG